MKKMFRGMGIGAFACLLAIFLSGTGIAVQNGGYVNDRFLVTTQWLEGHLNDPNVRILDRQDIFPKDDFYSKAHIPNAIRMPTSAVKGMKGDIREMLILKDLISFLEKNGVSADHHIILVGRFKRLPATTRVFWALEILGHRKMSILDGGIDKWRAEGRQLTTEVPHFPAVTYKVANFNRNLLMTGEELEGTIGLFDRLNFMVVDSRRPDEFAGKKKSRVVDKLGRIPGSTNLMFMKLLTGKGYLEFKPASDLRAIFQANGLTPDKHLAFTCVSGCFGTVDYFAARLLGYRNVSVYDGAWIEWCKRNYPVETGAPGMAKVVAQPAQAKEPIRAKVAEEDEGC